MKQFTLQNLINNRISSSEKSDQSFNLPCNISEELFVNVASLEIVQIVVFLRWSRWNKT